MAFNKLAQTLNEDSLNNNKIYYYNNGILISKAIKIDGDTKVAFFDGTPVIKQAVLTSANNTAITSINLLGSSVLLGASGTIIDNIRTRVNEIESRLQSYNLI